MRLPCPPPLPSGLFASVLPPWLRGRAPGTSRASACFSDGAQAGCAQGADPPSRLHKADSVTPCPPPLRGLARPCPRRGSFLPAPLGVIRAGEAAPCRFPKGGVGAAQRPQPRRCTLGQPCAGFSPAPSVLSADEYFVEDPKFSLCYCESCHKLRGDEAYYKRGEPPRDYALPFGWCRFSLRYFGALLGGGMQMATKEAVSKHLP